MRLRRAMLISAALLTLASAAPRPAAAASYQESSATKRVLYTGIALAANVMPIVSTIYAPRCLVGYVFCKAAFASVSVIAAADQLALSGGNDRQQTRGILYRGFAGDWFLTGAHVAGERTAEPLPDPPPPEESGGEEGGKWEPPPL